MNDARNGGKDALPRSGGPVIEDRSITTSLPSTDDDDNEDDAGRTGSDVIERPSKGVSAVVFKIVLVAVIVRSMTMMVLVILPLSDLVPCFDCSSHFQHRSIEGLVRWDTIHFVGMTKRFGLAGVDQRQTTIGTAHRLEQDWAFGQAIVWLLRFTGTFWTNSSSDHPGEYGDESVLSRSSVIVWVSVLASLASVGSSIVLFHLTFELFGSIRFATLTSLLHVFSPSPSTQVVPYTEPFYSLFSFAAIYGYVRLDHPSSEPRNLKRSIIARFETLPRKVLIALFTASATSFRSIGIFQSLLWVWDWLGELQIMLRLLRRTRYYYKQVLSVLIISTLETFMLGLVTCSPFLYDQWSGYRQFCKPGFTEPSSSARSIRSWCHNRIPSIYNFVQQHYWDVGFLKYWTWNQSPLFLLSMPLYWVSLSGIFNYYRFRYSSTENSNTVQAKDDYSEKENLDRRGEKRLKGLKDSHERPFLNLKIEIYVHIQLILTLLLLLNSHVQIILRQAATMPVVWWSLADGLGLEWNWWKDQITHPHQRFKYKYSISYWTWYLKWLSIWFPISIILWSGFYPPA